MIFVSGTKNQQIFCEIKAKIPKIENLSKGEILRNWRASPNPKHVYLGRV